MNGEKTGVRDSMNRLSISDRPLEGTLVLGRYRILRPLARGGMGMVYLGRIEGAAGFSKPVVVKRVLTHVEEGEDSRQQFVREARILSSLSHPGIVGVIDFAEEGDSYLMVLEYVHGYQLGHWLKYLRTTDRQMPWDVAVHIIIKVLRALHHAHTHRGPSGEVLEIIHRDVSPGNILLDVGGNVRLVDFGIARSKGDTGEYKTQEGVLKGKLPYIAPELYQSEDASASSDAYACAVVLYQLLAGRNPFVGKGMSDTVNKVLKLQPEAISVKRTEVPLQLDAVMRKQLAKDPARRYPNALAFFEALYAVLERSESEIQRELEALVHEDFLGGLPDALNLHRLSDLEEDWRTAAPDTDPSLLRASSPPPPPMGRSTGPEDARGEMATAVMPAETADLLKKEAARMVELADERTRASRASAMSHRTIVLSVLGGALIASAIAAGAVMALKKDPPPKERRYLVVDRLEAEKPAPADSADEETADPSSASETAEGPSTAEPFEADQKEQVSPRSASDPRAPTGPQAPAPGDAGGVAALTATFSQRQGEVQGCFARHADSLEGSPQLSIRFSVNRDGTVDSATLSPAPVAGTALGSCILDIAQTTRFAPREAPVAFSIPITARVVKQ